VDETVRVSVVSRDSPRVVDVLSKGPVAESGDGTRAGSIERSEFAARTAHKTADHIVRVSVVSRCGESRFQEITS